MNRFNQLASKTENADLWEGQDIIALNVNQVKNKIENLRKTYKAKKNILASTGNIALSLT